VVNVRWCLYAVLVAAAIVMLVATTRPAYCSPDANLTVVALTWGGQPLKEGARLPLVEVARPGEEPFFKKVGQVVTIENLTAGDYVVRIYWRNELVYERTVEVVNDTTVNAKCNVTVVKFYAADDEGYVVNNAVLVVAGVGDVKSGAEVLLPFGTYSVSRARVKLALEEGEIEVALVPLEESRVEVEGSTLETSIKLPLRHRVTFLFFKLGGVPLQGAEYSAEIYIDVEGELHLLERAVLTRNSLYFMALPYGLYTVRVYRHSEVKLEERVEVESGTTEVEIVVGLLARLRLKFTTKDGEPLAGFKVKIISPKGAFAEYILNEYGEVELLDVDPGLYEYVINVGGLETRGTINVAAGGQQLIGGGIEKTIRTCIARVLVRITDRGGAGLPPKLRASISYLTHELISQTLPLPAKELVLDAGYLPLDRSYRLVVTWEGVTIANETVTGSREVSLHFKHVKLKLESTAGDPVPEARLVVKLHNGTEVTLVTGPSGEALVLYAVGGYKYRVEAYWRGIKVGDGSFDPRELHDTEYVVKAALGSLTVRVEGLWGRPLKGAKVNLTITMVSGEVLNLYSEAGDDGIAFFRHVPLLAAGVERAYLVVSFERFSTGKIDITRELTRSHAEREVVLEVLPIIPGFALSTVEIAALTATLVLAVTAAALIYRKVVIRKEISELLSEATYTAPRRRMATVAYEREEREGFFARLKERLRILRGSFAEEEEEEEEEWGLFE